MNSRSRQQAPSESRSRGPIAVSIAVGVTALAPVALAIPPLDPYTPRFVGILASACAWFWAWVFAPDVFRADRRLLLAAGSVAVATLVSALASYSPGVELTFGAEGGLMSAATWLSLLAVFLFASSVKPSGAVLRPLRLLLDWGAVSAAIIVWERVSTSPTVTGGFGNSNYASAALVSLVPLAFFEASSETDGRRRSWWLYLAALLIGAIVWAGSLAGLIALAIVVAASCYFAPGAIMGIDRALGRRIAWGLVAVLTVAAIVLTLALATDVLPSPVDERVTTEVLGPTALNRLEMWKLTARIALEHPLLGVGPDGIQHVSQAYLTPRLLALEAGGYADYRVLMKDPHSLPLLVLGSLGAVGLAVLMWLALAWLAALRRLLSAADPTSRTWALRCALALGVAGHLAALCFMPWAVAFGPLLPLLAGVAVAGSAEPHSRDERRASSVVRMASAVVVTLVVALLAGSAVLGQLSIAAARKAETPELARDAYASAARVQPWRPYPAYEALYASGYLVSQGRGDVRAYQAVVDAAPDEVRESGAYLANLVQPLLDQAYISGRTDLSWERENIEAALNAAPLHPDVLLEQAHLELLSGDAETASALLDRVGEFSPNTPRYSLYRYYLALATNDQKTAGELRARLSTSNVNWLAEGWER